MWPGASARALLLGAVAVLVAGTGIGALVPPALLRAWPARIAAGIAYAAAATVAVRLASSLLRAGARRAAPALARFRAVASSEAREWADAVPPPARGWLAATALATALGAGWLGQGDARAFDALPSGAAHVVGVVLGVATALSTLLVVLAVGLALRRRVGRAVVAVCAAGVLPVAFTLPVLVGPEAPARFDPPEAIARALGDPTLPGPFAVRALRYGTEDYLRAGDHPGTAVPTDARLDARAGLAGWTAERTAFFGFGPDRLPLNARVWAPRGPGPFPLVLVAHGTADLTADSEDGFDYLGELLATRGYVVAALDMDFLGYGWRAYGTLRGDEGARAGLILAHLEEWERLSRQPDGPLAGLADLGRVALVGHSRGGEAATLAAQLLAKAPIATAVRVRAVAALAPTANRGEHALPSSYLVLHGDQDNDVEAFLGRRTYSLVELAAPADGPPRLKAAVYLAKANHAQFNRAWGSHDVPWPSAAIAAVGLLASDTQRRATALFVSAFLDAALSGSPAATAILRDVRVARELLPDVELVTKYLDGRARLLGTFDDDVHPETALLQGATFAAEGFSVWAERDPPLRLPGSFGSRGNRLARLEWSRGPGEAPPRFSLALPAGATGEWTSAGALTFAIGFPLRTAEVRLRVVDASGEAAAVPVTRAFALAPVRRSRLTRVPLLEPESAEMTLQTVYVPLSGLLRENPRIDVRTLRRIELVFETPTGVAFLDDLAYSAG